MILAGAVAEFHAFDNGQEERERDLVDTWTKVMTSGRFDLLRSRNKARHAALIELSRQLGLACGGTGVPGEEFAL